MPKQNSFLLGVKLCLDSVVLRDFIFNTEHSFGGVKGEVWCEEKALETKNIWNWPQVQRGSQMEQGASCHVSAASAASKLSVRKQKEVLLTPERGIHWETTASGERGHRRALHYTMPHGHPWEKSMQQCEAAGTSDQRTADQRKDPQLQEARQVHLCKNWRPKDFESGITCGVWVYGYRVDHISLPVKKGKMFVSLTFPHWAVGSATSGA